MMKNIHDIDKVFKDALEGHPVPAPPAVWELLNNDLDKKQAAHFREKYYRVKRLALLLLLFIVSGSSYLLFLFPPLKKDAGATQKNVSIPAKENSTGAGRQQNMPDQPGNSLPAETKKINQTAAAGEIPYQAILPLNKQQPGYHQQRSALLVAAKNINPKLFSAKDKTGQVNTRAESNRQQQEDNQENSASAEKTILANATYVYPLNEKNNASPRITKAGSPSAYLPGPALSFITFEPIAALYTGAFHPLALNDSATGNIALKTGNRNSGIKANPGHRFSLVVFGAPNHSFKRLEDDRRLASPGRDKREAKHSEQQGSSFSAGILLNYRLGKHVIVQSGATFSSDKTNITTKTVYARPDNNGHARYEFNCSSGYSYITPKTGNTPAIGDSMKITSSSSTNTYIGLPVSLNYVWQKGKFLFMPGAGVSMNFLKSGNSSSNFGNTGNKKHTIPVKGLKSMYMEGSLGLGAEYMLNRKISLSLRPLLRFALTSINKNTPVKTYQNYVSLEWGLKMNL